MQYFFSPSTVGWYLDIVHGDHIPADALPVSVELYESLQGKQIVAGPDGMPMEYVPVPSTVPELILRAKAETRVTRQPIIEILDGLQASALTLGETDKALVIETAKQGLRDITDLDLTGCATYEQMKALTLARYAQIANASPALKAAFSGALK